MKRLLSTLSGLMAAIALLVAAVLALGGVGGGQSAAAAPARASLASSLTKSQAIAFASAVNLRPGDLPGFTGKHEHEHEHMSAAEKQLEGRFKGCVGASSEHKSLFEANSLSFERESKAAEASVSSGVTVVRSSAVAQRELAAIKSARAGACLAHYFGLLLNRQKHSGVSVGATKVTAGTPPAPGSSGSFAWRLVTVLTIHGTPVPTYFDIFGFAYGPAEVTLFSSGVPLPLPAATEQRLFSLLVARARSASR